MKKTLIAIAALAATSAFAQSSVTISGLMDTGVAMYNLKGNKIADVAPNGAGTTAVIFSGVEDLGGGMKALFQYEIDPNLAQTSSRTAGTSATGTTSNVTSSLGNGQSFVGAETALGTVKFGTPNLATLSAHGDGNGGFSTAIGSGYRVSSFDAVRVQGSLRYDTPVVSGFAGSVVYSPKNGVQSNALSAGLTGNLQNQTNGRDAVTEYALSYANGPLTARYASLTVAQYAKVQTAADPLGVVAWTALGTGAKFNLDTASVKYAVNPALTVAGFYQTISSDSLKGAASGAEVAVKYDRKATGLAAAYAVTPTVTLMANYQQAKNGAGVAGAAAGTASKTTTVTGLGADYALSKRTVAYARYEKDADKAGLRAITGYSAINSSTTYTATAVGIKHTF